MIQQGSDVTHLKKGSQKLKIDFYLCIDTYICISYILKGTCILINICYSRLGHVYEHFFYQFKRIILEGFYW